MILADFETDVTIDAKGKYKPPSLIEKARQQLWQNTMIPEPGDIKSVVEV